MLKVAFAMVVSSINSSKTHPCVISFRERTAVVALWSNGKSQREGFLSVASFVPADIADSYMEGRMRCGHRWLA
jgi:hypothetical protein